MLGILANACSNGMGQESDNEFFMMHSGCGFNVSDLFVRFNTPAGPSIGFGTSFPFVTPPAGLLSLLQNDSGCSSATVIAANASTTIPAASIVLVFPDSGVPSVDYDISYLCSLGLPIYVLYTNRDFGSGVFSNSGGTTFFNVGACMNGITYSGLPAAADPNNVFVHANGSADPGNPCNDVPFSSISYPDIPNTISAFNWIIPTGVCGMIYISGIVDLLAPCLDMLLTPPSALSMSILCEPVIDPAGPFCPGSGNVTLTASPGGGTWGGGPYISPGGVFMPSVAGTGSHQVYYTYGGCPDGDTVLVVVDGPVIDDCPFCFFPTVLNCAGDSTGNIVPATSITGGTLPYTYDWDAVATPGNDVYPDDGNMAFPHGIYDLPAGDYYFIVTDANGCSDTVTITIDPGPEIVATFQVDSIACFGQTGGIQVVQVQQPPYGVNIYDWDWDGTPGNDDFGGPAAVDDDDADISGLSPGTYYITITVTDDLMFPTYACTYYDTFTLSAPGELIVTMQNDTVACFGDTNGSLTANHSGGSGPFTYNWSHSPPGPDDQTEGNLSPGLYIVTVTDANMCTGTALANVIQPTQLMVSATGSTIDCDDNTGTVSVTPSGGTPPYTYDWDNDGTGDFNDLQNLSGLNSGTYTVVVMDDNGCTATTTATVNLNPPTFMMPPDDGTIVQCVGDAQSEPLPPTVLNSCGDPLTITGPVVSADPVCSGPKTYTFTYTEPTTMATAQWVFTYNIDDTTPPMMTCPAPLNFECIGSVPAPFATLAAFLAGGGSASDNCGLVASTFMVSESNSGTCPRVITRTYSIEDSCGNMAQCMQTITIDDTMNPTITCPGPLNFECTGSIPVAFSTLAAFLAGGGSASDNCGLNASTFMVSESDNGTCPRTIMRTTLLPTLAAMSRNACKRSRSMTP